MILVLLYTSIDVMFHYKYTPMQYSVIMQKSEFSVGNLDFFLVFAQNIDCEYKYPQSLF